MQFKAGELKDMIHQVTFAASSDEARPVLQGVQIQINEAEIAMAATDGYRISVSKLPLETPVGKARDIIVPDPLFARVRGHFDERAQVDLVATIGAYNMVSRFLCAFEIGH